MKRMILNEDGVISPRKGPRDPELPRDAVMIMVRREVDRITREVCARKIPFAEMHLYGLFEAASTGCRPVSIAGPFFGAPHAATGLEKLIALGVRRVWVLGWCGALDPRLSVGSMVVPSEAFSEEGVSRLYAGQRVKPAADGPLLSKLDDALLKRGLHALKGPVWTTDALYRETPSKIRAYRTLGAVAVEMELSALMSIAVFRSVALAALLVVSDVLSPTGWHPGFSDPRLAQSSRAAGSVVTALASGEL